MTFRDVFEVLREMLGTIIFFLIYPFLLIYDNIADDIRFRKEQKEWLANSFLFDGCRYSKDTFKVVDEKIEFK
jgi:hypothetical protein